jgi:Tol biopolymer transport system component
MLIRRASSTQRRSTKSMTRLAATVGMVLIATLATPPAASPTDPDRNPLIAFLFYDPPANEIYTVRPNGHDLRQITRVDGEALQSDWAPDGRRIVFELGTVEAASIAIMNADGSDLTNLTGTGLPGQFSFAGQPSFTPDGQRIVFERYIPDTNDDAIWSMNVDGSDQRRITSGPGGVTDPNVSPDGKRLSFVGFNGEDLGQALFTADIDGNNLHQLTPFTFDVAVKQDWAPDGEHLVFTDNADNFDEPANIATIRRDGTDLRYLTHYQSPELRAYTGSYSPDGQWIIFRLEDHGSFALFRMRPDGSELHAILPSSDFRPRGIDWGPAPEH